MAKPCTVPDCTKSAYTAGKCNMHYKRVRKYGTSDDPRQTIEQRFWSKVDASGSCWLWTGVVKDTGYGSLSVEGQPHYAHRLSYEMSLGPIPKGMFIDHRCHNRACVRPEHLRVVSNKQNLENMAGAKTTSKSGIRGVYRRDYGRWQVQVTHNRRVYNGGTHIELADAEAAAIALRNKLYTHNDVDRAA